VSGSADNSLRLWHADGSFLRQLAGPTATVTSVAFSPDSQWIVSGSSDQTLRLWNADTGQQIGQPFTGHTDKVNGVAFSPDGRQIVSGSADTSLRLWDVPPASTWSDMLCDKLTTNMNRGQWSQWVSRDIPYYDEVCHGLPLAPETP
jgi:WD40 repeat protein